MARILVFGNEKGGAGKSTMAMHVTSALLYSNKKIGILDLDLRQLSLTRFFENRLLYTQQNKVTLPMPELVKIIHNQNDATNTWEGNSFETALHQLHKHNDYIVIDCPGALTPLSTLAHAKADTLITPLNDSFIDFDLLARINPQDNSIIGPSIYSEMVWNGRKDRALLSGGLPIDWVVARNRLSAINMHNKRKVGIALTSLSKRIGFRFIPGLSDRVIYRELFPLGLTLLDHKQVKSIPTKMSNIASRQEIRDLILALNLPNFMIDF